MTDAKTGNRVVSEAVDAKETGGPASISGVWKCPDCGGQIQIIVPQTALNQPFICMCGAPMVPGEGVP